MTSQDTRNVTNTVINNGTENHNTASQNAALIDIASILGILWRRKILILACFIGAVGLAFAYLMVAKPIYSANAVVLIDPREANTTSTPNVLGGIGTDSAAIASQVSIIGSTEALKAVFTSLDLQNDPEFNQPGLIGSILGSGGNPEAAFDSFRGRLSIAREGLTYVINIGFTSTDAEKAARIANAVANQYISGQVAEKSDVSSEVTDQLNQSIAQLRQQVTEAETKVQQFRVENNLFDTGTGRTLVEEQVTQLNAQLTDAQQAARDAASRYEQARTIGASAAGLDRLSQFLNSGPAEQLRNTYNQRRTELANAEAALGPQHPTRVRIAAEIENLNRQMRDEAARIITELKATSELAAANVQRVQDDLVRLQTQSAMTNQQAVQLRQLERNAEASRQVLEQFLARSEQTSQLDELQRPDARIVSNATPPLRASWPKRSLVLAGAGLFGLIIGSIIALAKDGRRLLAGSVAVPQPATETQNEAIATPAKTRRPAPPRRPQPAMQLTQMGTLATRFAPPNHYLPSTAYLDAIHAEALDYPDEDFALGLQSLFEDLAAKLPETAPAIVHICSLADRLEANRIAFALAQEASQSRWQPLIVDLDPLKPSASNRLYDDATTDAATGLTIATPNDGRDDAERAQSAIYEHGHDADIIFVIGKPLTDPASLGAGFAEADITLIVIGTNENQRLLERTLNQPQNREAQPALVTIAHGTQSVAAPSRHRSDDVSRAVADLRHLVRRRAS